MSLDHHFDVSYHEKDPDFSTPFDFTIARLRANTMLLQYLNKEISIIDSKLSNYSLRPSAPSRELTWRGKKIELYALLIALHGRKCFGDVSLSDIAHFFEYVFDMSLDKNLSRVKEDLRERSNPLRFVEELVKSLDTQLEYTKKEK